MKTVYKIKIARALYRMVHIGRGLVGRTDREKVVREGIAYDLDLAQGIDFAIYLGGIFERDTARALAELVEPSSLVLDIGANIGAHTLRLAKFVGPGGKVLAFEPTDFAFTKLKRNIALNPGLAARIEAHNCFLADRDDAETPGAIYSSWPLLEEENLHALHFGQEMQVSARARTLDGILAERNAGRVKLVKLDVDGYECSVLRGAGRMLGEDKPIVVMELAPYVLEERGTSLAELLSFFAPHGYAFFHERTNKPLPFSDSELKAMIAPGESMNVIARVS